MSGLPRIALGTIQPNADSQMMLWALLGSLRSLGLDSQLFQSQSRFIATDAGLAACGKRTRYLDSWLMTPEICRSVFQFGSRGCDLSVVVGKYCSVAPGVETGRWHARCAVQLGSKCRTWLSWT